VSIPFPYKVADSHFQDSNPLLGDGWMDGWMEGGRDGMNGIIEVYNIYIDITIYLTTFSSLLFPAKLESWKWEDSVHISHQNCAYSIHIIYRIYNMNIGIVIPYYIYLIPLSKGN